jgi:nitrogen fixation protein NifB
MDVDRHPCFNAGVRHSAGRVHLPVAEKCNIRCNHCNRKYDCVNESRPGLTSAILSPSQVLEYLGVVLRKINNISGITVKINTVIIPGINDAHAVQVAKTMVGLGADIQNCVPMIPVAGTPFEHLGSPDAAAMEGLRLEAGNYLRQMSHCGRCRADAAGLIGDQNRAEIAEFLEEAGTAKPSAERPYVAAASREGLFVNRHLGEASSFHIVVLENGRPVLKERRPAPEPGTGDARWEALADTLRDCFAILCGDCGENPRRILERRGFALFRGEGLINDIAGYLFTEHRFPTYTAPKPAPAPERAVPEPAVARNKE